MKVVTKPPIKIKTFIKWSGNKSRYLKHILPLVPKKYKTYIEPFTGSGAVFLQVQPSKWIINDLNTDLINVWRLIQNDLPEILKEVGKFARKHKTLPKDKHKSVLFYRKLTNTFTTSTDPIKRATQYLVLKNLVYMGILLRGTKPYFRGYDMSIHKRAEPFVYSKTYSKLLKAVSDFMNSTNGTIQNKDYKLILKKAKKNDFVFLDPPYIEDHKYDFKYNENEVLDDAFLTRLHSEMISLDKKGVKFLMTQADTPMVRKLFGNFIIKEFTVYRNKSKQYKKELLIRNYN